MLSCAVGLKIGAAVSGCSIRRKDEILRCLREGGEEVCQTKVKGKRKVSNCGAGKRIGVAVWPNSVQVSNRHQGEGE